MRDWYIGGKHKNRYLSLVYEDYIIAVHCQIFHACKSLFSFTISFLIYHDEYYLYSWLASPYHNTPVFLSFIRNLFRVFSQIFADIFKFFPKGIQSFNHSINQSIMSRSVLSMLSWTSEYTYEVFLYLHPHAYWGEQWSSENICPEGRDWWCSDDSIYSWIYTILGLFAGK